MDSILQETPDEVSATSLFPNVSGYEDETITYADHDLATHYAGGGIFDSKADTRFHPSGLNIYSDKVREIKADYPVVAPAAFFDPRAFRDQVERSVLLSTQSRVYDAYHDLDNVRPSIVPENTEHRVGEGAALVPRSPRSRGGKRFFVHEEDSSEKERSSSRRHSQRRIRRKKESIWRYSNSSSASEDEAMEKQSDSDPEYEPGKPSRSRESRPSHRKHVVAARVNNVKKDVENTPPVFSKRPLDMRTSPASVTIPEDEERTPTVRLSRLDAGGKAFAKGVKYIGVYGPDDRIKLLERFRRRRGKRNFNKKVRYACRKEVALRRRRVGGRFVKIDR